MKNKFIIIIFSFIMFSCYSESGKDEPQINPSYFYYNDEDKITPEITEHYTLSFLAAGDNLLHSSVYMPLMIGEKPDLSFLYSEVKDIVEKADVAFINQETVMAGESYGYTGYPLFNAPQRIANALADTGFDIINLANNHAMDMGSSGLYATLDFLDTMEEFTVIGARKQGESARIITKNNITLGFLSYTYSLNGIALPSNNPNLVSLINRNKMSEEITALRPLCDFLIVSMHWGEEYRLQPGNDQISLAYFLAEHNVDLIVGHHPHVLQKAELIRLDDGRKTLCFYSLGNFISHQNERERIIGALMAVTFSKTVSNINPASLSIINYGFIPVITHYDRSYRNTKSYPLFLYTDDLLQSHGLRYSGDGLSMNFFNTVLDRLNARIIMHNPFIKQNPLIRMGESLTKYQCLLQ